MCNEKNTALSIKIFRSLFDVTELLFSVLLPWVCVPRISCLLVIGCLTTSFLRDDHVLLHFKIGVLNMQFAFSHSRGLWPTESLRLTLNILELVNVYNCHHAEFSPSRFCLKYMLFFFPVHACDNILPLSADHSMILAPLNNILNHHRFPDKLQPIPWVNDLTYNTVVS